MKKSYKVAILLAVVILLAAWAASRRMEARPASGRGFQADSAVSLVPKSKLRIATFNIHRCKGDDGRRDLPRVAELLQGLDFVGLNEVAGNELWDSESQAESLAKRLKLSWLFSPVQTRLLDGDFGNGALTNLPVRSWQKINLPYNGNRKSARAALLIVLETGQRPINMLVAHLDHRDKALPDHEGHKQLDTVISLFLSLAEPAVLMGDFNAYPNEPLILELKATPGVTEVVAASATEDQPGRVDWIFLRGMHCLDAKVIPNEASDHPIVWADVEITP
jgi:endonuclease/exonuclease/phosphatase family metal-dependent hydrolase